VFVPLDSAFDDALSAGVIKNSILHDKEWSLHLEKLLRHHMVLDSMLSTDQLEEQVAAAASASSSNGQQRQYLTMASGEKVALGNKTKAGDVPNLGLGEKGEVSFIKANLRAENGVVHVMNGLLRPKFLSMTVMDILEQKQNLSTFARLIVLAGLDDELRNIDAEFTVSLNSPLMVWSRLVLVSIMLLLFLLGSTMC
jgi:Fasciclin domain